MTKTKPQPLTKMQAAVLAFICRYFDREQFPPTVRDIGEHFGIASPNGVMCHLKALEAKGWITRRENVSRGIRVLKRPPAKRKAK